MVIRSHMNLRWRKRSIPCLEKAALMRVREVKKLPVIRIPQQAAVTLTLSQTEIITRAQEAFDNAQKAQQDGDWAKYGEYLKELDKYLNMLSE